MPAAKSPELYEQMYWDIAEAFNQSPRELVLSFPNKRAATRFRFRIYGFRNALERRSQKAVDSETRNRCRELYQAIRYMRIFMEQKDGNYNLSLRHAAQTIDEDMLDINSQVQARLLERKRPTNAIDMAEHLEESSIKPSSEDGGASIFEMFGDGD